jgi:hypothetical protein
VGGIVGIVISAFIAYWVIRWGVCGGMRDFEKWQRKRDRERYDQYDE